MNPAHVLTAKNLYAGYDKKTVLQDVTITIPSNKISVIIGGMVVANPHCSRRWQG